MAIKYEYNLILRMIFLLTPIKIFEIIFRPLTIYSSYFLFYVFNLNPYLFENSIAIKDSYLIFSSACIAAPAYFLLMFLIVTTKDIKFERRIFSFLIGSLLILIMNVIRIFILGIILVYYGIDLFNAIHLLFWSLISGVYVAVVWIFIVYYMKIKSIPIYDDIKYLYRKSLLKKN